MGGARDCAVSRGSGVKGGGCSAGEAGRQDAARKVEGDGACP